MKRYYVSYPNGKSKALTFSYDDGMKHDRRLVELFNRYGLKGTFHLNGGLFPEETGMRDVCLNMKWLAYMRAMR